MRKSILLSVFSFLAASCSVDKVDVKPIEKYQGVGYVIIASRGIGINHVNIDLQLKNSDTIFWVTVPNFDGRDLKVGDSIK